jgi:signal transduction histidine kinase
MRAVTVADLRPVDLFDDIDDAALAEWAAAAELWELEAGGTLSEQGQRSTGLHCLLSGNVLTLLVGADGKAEPIGRMLAPTWIGAIATLTEGTLNVRMQADGACRLASIPPERARRLALSHPAVHRRIMQQVAPVMSRITGVEQNRERLAALGRMAAGLAHELNNPAAAAQRAAADLGTALERVIAALAHFVESGVEREDAARLVDLQREALAQQAARTPLDALDAADAEDELIQRIEALGVEEAWRLAEPLSLAGVDAAWLARVEAAAGRATGSALEWVGASLTARGLVGELTESTQRISHLVGAVKTYAYMDRGGVVEVDVHEGLETTLVVLGHKLKHTQIEVVRDYDRTLPKLIVRGSELNQVWTNLLDNAIDALGKQGTITLRTRREGDCLLVEVADDGPGIPPAIIDRVFDPFFTTKGVGEGTGLGLDTAHRIVAVRHDGSLSVDSRPGATTFHVRLPLE